MSAWLEVELAATDAWAAEGVVPRGGRQRPAASAPPSRSRRSEERERTTGHDVAAFVDVVAGIDRRARAVDPLRAHLLGRPRHGAGAAAARGRRDHRRRRARVPRRAGRAGPRAPRRPSASGAPTASTPSRPRSACGWPGFAFEADRNLDRLEGAFEQARGRQALRRRRHLRLGAARGRGTGDGGARPSRARTSQPRSFPRDRHAVRPRLRSRSPAAGWSASRPRSATSSAPRSARSRSRSARARRAPRRCRTSATRSSRSASRGLARVLRGYAQTGFENVALWHERDISHSGRRAGRTARRDDRSRLHAAPRRAGRRRDDRPP